VARSCLQSNTLTVYSCRCLVLSNGILARPAHFSEHLADATGALRQAPEQPAADDKGAAAGPLFHGHDRNLLSSLLTPIADLKISGPLNCGKEGSLLVNPLQLNGVRFGSALGMSKDASIITVGAPFAPPNADDQFPGGASLAFTQYNGGTSCIFQSTYLPFLNDTAKWMGAQVAASRDGKFMASVDGYDGKVVNGRVVGNAPIVNLYVQNTTKAWTFLQRLNVRARRAQLTAIAVSFNRDASALVLSYSIDGDSLDKRGSAQIFVRSGPMNEFSFSQDLSDLNHPSGNKITADKADLTLTLSMVIA
jgi:hypothetical protein